MEAGWRNQNDLINSEEYIELIKIETICIFNNEKDKAEEARRKRERLEEEAREKDKEELKQEQKERKEKTLRRWRIIK